MRSPVIIILAYNQALLNNVKLENYIVNNHFKHAYFFFLYKSYYSWIYEKRKQNAYMNVNINNISVPNYFSELYFL